MLITRRHLSLGLLTAPAWARTASRFPGVQWETREPAYLGLDEDEYEEEVEERVEGELETEFEQGTSSGPGAQLEEQLEAEDPTLDDDAEGR